MITGLDGLPVVDGSSAVIGPTLVVADTGPLLTGATVQCLLWLAAEDLAAGGGGLLLDEDQKLVGCDDD